MQETVTIDHGEIRRWAEARGGMPAVVAGTDADLRFDWGEGGRLERISWEDFFELFEEQDLAFAHIEDDDSSVYEFVPRSAEFEQDYA